MVVHPAGDRVQQVGLLAAGQGEDLHGGSLVGDGQTDRAVEGAGPLLAASVEPMDVGRIAAPAPRVCGRASRLVGR